MLISQNWLQKYFKNKLPETDELVELLTFHVFEIESTEKKGSDTVLDVKVLPDRACYALSHKGIAYEVSAITGMPVKKSDRTSFKVSKEVKSLSVKVEEPKLCPRYIGRRIEGVKIGESPKWLKESLEAIGQKSINNIVDATNYVMYDCGQPLHAFDADKVKGGITVRRARAGEKMTTLDNKEVNLTTEVLVIADDEGPLAIAGIKGGKLAEIDSKTKNIIIESANFNASFIRRGSQIVNIKTDGGKRHESNLALVLPESGMLGVTELVSELCPEAKFGEVSDSYKRAMNQYKIGTDIEYINKKLGVEISESEILKIFGRLNIKIEKVVPEKLIVDVAKALVGKPYKHGASVTYDAPESFDCSSLTSYMYVQAGFAIPRISVEQFLFGKSVEEKDIKLGDLVFTKGVHPYFYDEAPEGIGHVGMYLGDNKVIQASGPSHANKVVIGDLKDWTKSAEFRGIRRMTTDLKSVQLVATIPSERLDLRIKEDLVEEIGRIYGYEKIESALPPKLKTEPKILKELYYNEKIKDILIGFGFSEIFTSSFSNKGDIEIEKSLASDKNFARTELSTGVNNALKLNASNAELIGIGDVKIFEIGRVFDSRGENTALAIGVKKIKKVKGVTAETLVNETVSQVEKAIGKLGGKIKQTEGGCIYEVRINEIVNKFPEPKTWDIEKVKDLSIKYQKISAYPYIARDVALFVGARDSEESVRKIIENALEKVAGDLLVKGPWCFDKFEKDGKKSMAFRMIFQSFEKTLTDNDANGFMEKLYSEAKNQGWTVR